MFNFLFDGKISEILAPVVPSNQLFLAIQHHKNNEISNLLDSIGYNPMALADGGYAAIHVACRYNNRYALDILLAKGTNIQLSDQNGNTPLHFAAKYGHIDLCKYLIERGASVIARNKQRQSTYDVAENHIVRQYLLPILLSAERESQEAGQTGIAPPPSYFGGNTNNYGYSVPPSTYLPQQSYPAPQQYPIPQGNTTIAGSTGTVPLTPLSTNVPPPQPTLPVPPNTAAANIPTIPPVMPNPPPMSNFQQPQTIYGNTSKPSNIRVIQPDGFHSSASDPVLQQKYGHIIEKPAIAPPPTGSLPFNSYSNNYSQPPVASNPVQNNVFSRYVAYDATTNSAIPPPMAYQPPVQVPPAQSLTQQPPIGVYSTSSISTPLSVPSTSTHTSSQAPTTAEKLLGNKSVGPNLEQLQDFANQPGIQIQYSRPVVISKSNSGNQNVEGDEIIIDANSNSNSVL